MPTGLHEMNQQYLDVVIRQKPMDVTYEVSYNEPIHPDVNVVVRMREVAIGNCEYGCKIYADPRSAVRVLAHNNNYGCTK